MGPDRPPLHAPKRITITHSRRRLRKLHTMGPTFWPLILQTPVPILPPPYKSTVPWGTAQRSVAVRPIVEHLTSATWFPRTAKTPVPAITGLRHPHALANYMAPREVVGRSPRRYIALMPDRDSLTGGNGNSFHTNSPQPKTSLPWPLNAPSTNHTNDVTQP